MKAESITLTKYIPFEIASGDGEVLSNWINDWIMKELEENNNVITVVDIRPIATGNTSAVKNIILYKTETARNRIFKIVKFQSPIDKTIDRVGKAYELISRLPNPKIEDFTFIDDHASRELDHIVISYSYESIDPDVEEITLLAIEKL